MPQVLSSFGGPVWYVLAWINAISNSSTHSLSMSGRNLPMNRCIKPTEQNKLLKPDTLKTKKYTLNSFKFNFWKLFYSSKLGYTYFKCLYFSHSSILEFGGGHTIKQLPQESPDLSACPWLLRLQIWCFTNFLRFYGLTKFMLKWICCSFKGSYDDFCLWDIYKRLNTPAKF